MTTKKITIYVAFIIVIAFLLGYQVAVSRSSLSTIKTEAKEINHTKTVITTVKKPDGTVTTVETVDSKTKAKTEATASLETPKKQLTNISALVGNDFSKSPIIPLYGISIQREIVGPLTVGAFGLTNGTIGVSIGLNF